MLSTCTKVVHLPSSPVVLLVAWLTTSNSSAIQVVRARQSEADRKQHSFLLHKCCMLVLRPLTTARSTFTLAEYSPIICDAMQVRVSSLELVCLITADNGTESETLEYFDLAISLTQTCTETLVHSSSSGKTTHTYNYMHAFQFPRLQIMHCKLHTTGAGIFLGNETSSKYQCLRQL